MTLADRERFVQEFLRLEPLNALCRVQHVMALRDCGRASVYRDRKLMAKRKRRGTRGIGFLPSDVRASLEFRR